MNKLLVVLGLCSSAVACGAPEQKPVIESPELTDLTLSIQTRAAKFGCELPLDLIESVGFGDLPAGQAGVCELAEDLMGNYSREDTKIKLDPTYWSTLSSCRKEMLLTHELGHCSLHILNHSKLMWDVMSTSLPHAEAQMCEELLNDFWRGRKCKSQKR